MSVDPLRYSATGLDLTARFAESVAVVGSPAAAAETIICQLPPLVGENVLLGVMLHGFAAFTVGTSGTAATLRIRRTNASGTVIVNSGAVTGGIAAGNLVTLAVDGLDSAALGAAQVYVLTLQITAGAAASTVSATSLRAIVV